MNHDKPNDRSTVTVIGHICIRDPDTKEIIVRKRDIPPEKVADDQ